MTLSKHIVILKTAIVISVLFIAALACAARDILPYYPQIEEGVQNRAVSNLIAGIFPASTNPYISFITLSTALLWALGTLILIYYFFEKTQSVEVNFFIFFVFSLVFEVLRTSIPLRIAFQLPASFLSMSAHILVFWRYFGLSSLLIAGLYSAGLSIEKEENVIFPLFIISVFLSVRIPINTFTYDSSFCLVNGYPMTFKIMEIVVIFLTMLSFFAGAFKSGQKEYYFVGIGSFLVLVGRALLVEGDTYILPVIGLAFLCGGVYFITVYLKKIYLWI